MIKVSVMYANTPGARFDHTHQIKARLGDACKHYSLDKAASSGERDVRSSPSLYPAYVGKRSAYPRGSSGRAYDGGPRLFDG